MPWRTIPILLSDVNVLVYAHRRDADRHGEYRNWLEGRLRSDEPFGVSELVLSGFVRVVTHPRVFKTPTPLAKALDFAEVIRTQRNVIPVTPGARHWDIFERLCRSSNVKGNLVSDAYFAALAIETGCEWITTDRDFARFDDLRWRHPLDR